MPKLSGHQLIVAEDDDDIRSHASRSDSMHEMSARMDMLEARFDDLDAKQDARDAKLEAKFDAKFEALLAAMNARFDAMQSVSTSPALSPAAKKPEPQIASASSPAAKEPEPPIVIVQRGQPGRVPYAEMRMPDNVKMPNPAVAAVAAVPAVEPAKQYPKCSEWPLQPWNGACTEFSEFEFHATKLADRFSPTVAMDFLLTFAMVNPVRDAVQHAWSSVPPHARNMRIFLDIARAQLDPVELQVQLDNVARNPKDSVRVWVDNVWSLAKTAYRNFDTAAVEQIVVQKLLRTLPPATAQHVATVYCTQKSKTSIASMTVDEFVATVTAFEMAVAMTSKRPPVIAAVVDSAAAVSADESLLKTMLQVLNEIKADMKSFMHAGPRKDQPKEAPAEISSSRPAQPAASHSACFNCGGRGHRSAQCPSAPKQRNAQRAVAAVQEHVDPDAADQDLLEELEELQENDMAHW